jgi:membrane-associated phospholipid phosphatase
VLSALDQNVSVAVAHLRWAPFTAVFLVASMWWVKGALFAAVGACDDLRRGRIPVSAPCVAAASAAAAGLTALAKEVFDRARPPLADPTFHAVVSTPGSPSFPSGHASTAFAAATVIALLHPRLRWPALGLAAVVAASRVYLGVPFTSDVVVGALLGVSIGAATVWAVRHSAAFGRTLLPAVRALLPG